MSVIELVVDLGDVCPKLPGGIIRLGVGLVFFYLIFLIVTAQVVTCVLIGSHLVNKNCYNLNFDRLIFIGFEFMN